MPRKTSKTDPSDKESPLVTGTESLLQLTAAFDLAEISYMIVGSYSSNFYGVPRSTKDADLVVHLSSSEWSRLPDILPAGIELEDQMSFEMVTSTRRELLRVEGTLFQIELFKLSDDSHDRCRFDRRKKVDIFPGKCVYLPTAEDVIVQKLRWSKVPSAQKISPTRLLSSKCKGIVSTGPTSKNGARSTGRWMCSPKRNPKRLSHGTMMNQSDFAVCADRDSARLSK